MLNLDATKLLDAIIFVRDRKFRDWEARMSRYGALQAFIDNAELMLPPSLVENTRTSPVRGQKIPVLNKMSIDIINERSCTIQGNNGVSTLVPLSWITKGFEIVVAPAVNAGNMIAREEDYAWQLLNGLIAVFGDLDTAAAAALETNKATSLVANELAPIDAGSYVMTKEDIYFYVEAVLNKNDLYGPFADVSNTESIATWKKYWDSFGPNNQQNKAGVADRYFPYRSNRVVPGVDNSEVHYFVPDGAIGVYNWNHWEAQNNIDFGNGTKVTIKEDPVLGLKWAVTTKTECRDLSATHGAGYEATYVQLEQWISDFTFVAAYSSDNKTPITKVVIRKPPVTPAPSVSSFTTDVTGGDVPQEVVFNWTVANLVAGYKVMLDLGLGGAEIDVTGVSTYTHEYTAAGTVESTLSIVEASSDTDIDSETVELTFTSA